jgi:adenine-specific DNA-methyltransferase
VRFIGSKARLLGAIEELLCARGVAGGTLLDVFCGTSAVGRHFKERGFRVLANDRMRLAWVRAKALVEVDARPRGLTALVREVEAASDVDGLITRQYSPAGDAGRMYFTAGHARRIDAALELLAERRRVGALDDASLFLVLAGVLAGADKVANISGTYGAFLKRWQTNTRRLFRVEVPAPVRGRPRDGCRAFRDDANELVRQQSCDVLYIDPPYNGREYSANYHVLEAIAARPFLVGDELAAFEASIYGKTGLLPYERSDFCSKRRVCNAFSDLIRGCRAEHVVVSYNEEGLLSADDIRGALARGLGAHPEAIEHHEVVIKRFRSDADDKSYRDAEGRCTKPRRYKRLTGRKRDELHEWLFYARRGAVVPAPALTLRAVGAA